MANTKKLPPPFSGPAPKEVPLKRAPLVRVLTQIKFPLLLSVADAKSVAPFQDLIRSAYPIGDKETVQRLEISAETPQQPVKTEAESIWRFHDLDKHWRVSLGTTFLALETTRYASRKDFIARIIFLVAALERTFNPQVTTRVGLRYIDRIEGDAVANIHDLIRSEVLGSYTLFAPAVRHIFANGEFNTEEGATLTARWGMLPPAGTIDPNVLEPIPDQSWILDLDVFTADQGNFNAATLELQLKTFAERIYAVFRYMVTDKFLVHYGRN
jgi:uncharacterized protein (TIGR04255 family)